MRNIVLQRRVAVQCWHVIADVAKASARPELMPVLLRAREQKQTTAEDVAAHLFFEPRSRRVVAERLLHIAARYGLLAQHERSFTLTTAGAQALDSEQVFVPEHGTWTVWTSEDPLLGYPILRVEPWRDPAALDEVRGGNKQTSPPRAFVEVPRALRAVEGRVAAPPAGGGGLIRVDKWEERAERVASNDVLQLRWNVSEGKLRLDGSLQGSQVSTVIDAPTITEQDVWRQLLESAGQWSRWDAARNALLVSFDETRDPERESLVRDLPIEAPTLGALGKFDALTLRGVALQARTGNDALRWAEWRLRARVRDYATSERFDAWTTEATAPFAAHRISLPNRADLTLDTWGRRGERPAPIAWHLAAAEDWSL
jgi:hypothetical protein